MAFGFCSAASITRRRVPAVAAAAYQGHAVRRGCLVPADGLGRLSRQRVERELMLLGYVPRLVSAQAGAFVVQFGNEGVGARLCSSASKNAASVIRRLRP